MFPWRTINGEEASAYYAAGTAQYHINADIMYALRKYVQATGDDPFLRELSELALGRFPIFVELTERALIDDPAQLLAAVARMRALGAGIALDDVGADPRSLALMPFLAPEVIKRVVQANIGRFRGCYVDGLHRNPKLAGKVVTKFVIGRDGLVQTSADGGSDLPDPSVVSCVARAFMNLEFPSNPDGIATVVYPFDMQPEQ